MKKLLLILLCLPFIGFGQTSADYFDKATNYLDSKEYKLAIDNYTKCIELKPSATNLATAYNDRGLAYMGLVSTLISS